MILSVPRSCGAINTGDLCTIVHVVWHNFRTSNADKISIESCSGMVGEEGIFKGRIEIALGVERRPSYSPCPKYVNNPPRTRIPLRLTTFLLLSTMRIGKCERIVLHLFTFASLPAVVCILFVSSACAAISYHGFCQGHGQAIETPSAQLSTNKQNRLVLRRVRKL